MFRCSELEVKFGRFRVQYEEIKRYRDEERDTDTQTDKRHIHTITTLPTPAPHWHTTARHELSDSVV